jgi:hypothetical protein
MVLRRGFRNSQDASSSGRSGSKKFWSYDQLPFQNSQASFAFENSDRNQPNCTMFAAGNYDVLAHACFFNQTGKSGFSSWMLTIFIPLTPSRSSHTAGPHRVPLAAQRDRPS